MCVLRTAPEYYFRKKKEKSWIRIFGSPLSAVVGSCSAFRAENKQHFRCTELGEFCIFPQILPGCSLAGVP